MIQCLEERYSSLIFLLQHLSYPKRDSVPYIKIQVPSLSEIEVLYLDGLKYLSDDSIFRQWLDANCERDLVIIEEDLGTIAAFLEDKEKSEILLHPQVLLVFLLEGKERDQLYDEIALEFPFRKIEVIGDEAMRLSLMRKSTVAEALFVEDLHYHRVFENVRLNAEHFLEAYDGDLLDGAFQGIPAIVCGAGPSLASDLETLKTLRDRALIFAGGSTMTALSKGGVKPHLTFAMDPNPQEIERLQGSLTFEVPLFYGGRVRPGVFDLMNGIKVYLRTYTGGPFENYLQHKLNLGRSKLAAEFDEEALSVTTTCLSMAVRFGCNPIILVGLDLAFTGGKSYAPGVIADSKIDKELLFQDARASERLLQRVGHDGQPVYTLVKWVMESESIASFVKRHVETQFFNATQGGLGFEGVPFTPLSSIDLGTPRDLEGLVHAHLIQQPLKVDPKDLEELLLSVKESLNRCLLMICEMLKDPKTETFLIYDLEVEEAFIHLIYPILSAVTKMVKRKYRNDINKQNESKWNYLKSVVEYLLTIA
jgi:hypothetical protein